jgi:hypothetical protein
MLLHQLVQNSKAMPMGNGGLPGRWPVISFCLSLKFHAWLYIIFFDKWGYFDIEIMQLNTTAIQDIKQCIKTNG